MRQITQDDFNLLMKEIFSSSASEDAFIDHLEQTWGVSENHEDTEFKAKVSALIYRIREALLTQVENVINDEGVQRELFNRFDLNSDGNLSILEVESMISTLGVELDRSCLNNLMTRFDADHSKTLSFSEFVRIIKD